jgi:aryl-alcohol dehydrogenase-like predicted oxidoreductase
MLPESTPKLGGLPMPEEGIETQDLKDALEEQAEHAEHAKHAGGEHHEEKKASWITLLSLSTAIIAVLAAVAALESGSMANDSIVQKNESILNQSKANDQWAYFQAKGIKSVIYSSQAEAIAAQNADAAAKLQAEAKHEKDDQAESMKKAQEFEKGVDESDKESEHSLHIHHLFAKAVTIFQVAIALAAIAALTRKKMMWYVSLATGLAGVWYFVQGFMF